MTTYIILSRFSPEAFADPRDFKQLARAVSEKIKSECPGVVWKDSFALMGRFDVIDIVESDDPEQVEKTAMTIRELETNADALRLRMLREPRGYPAMCCNLILPPTHPDADAGFVIMEQTEYPAMSGTNTICVTTVLLETGMLPMEEPVTNLVLESPAGLIPVRADCANSKVTRVTFKNVPAFAVYLDAEIENGNRLLPLRATHSV